MTTVANLLAEAPPGLPRREAEILLCHVLGRNRAWLVTHDSDRLPLAQVTAFRTIWARRLAGEPVAYLIGHRAFWTLDLAVTPAVLIPRPDTELLVERALALIPAGAAWELADLGTGSGALALALARERADCRVTASERSPAALAVARANAHMLGIENVEFRLGDWWTPLDGLLFDLVVSNPPYVAADDPHLQQGDLRFEPVEALTAGPEGLDDLRRIILGGPDHLNTGGHLLMEHGHDQGQAVRSLLREAGFRQIQTWRDLGGHERVTEGARGPA